VGVRVTDKGRGLLTQNEIHGCESANVRIDDEAEPIMRNNKVLGRSQTTWWKMHVERVSCGTFLTCV
jgi:hypothetical protein